MGSHRTPPSQDPLAVVRTELLHETEQTRVTRLVYPAGSVIRKEPLGSGSRRRLRHEVEILERLVGVEGVVQLADSASTCPGSVLLADVGGVVLSGRTMPLDPAELVDLAGSLARTVAAMHRRGVVHRDISPASIVLGGDHGVPHLIDFDRSQLDTVRIINRLMPPAYFSDQDMLAWLTVTTLEIWARHGPDPTLLGPAGHITIVTIVRRRDYRTGWRVMRRILAVCQARGYEPDVWQARFLYGCCRLRSSGTPNAPASLSSSPIPPATTGSAATRTSPTWTAARYWLYPS